MLQTGNRKGDYKRLTNRSSIAKSLRLYVNEILVTCTQKNTYRKYQIMKTFYDSYVAVSIISRKY